MNEHRIVDKEAVIDPDRRQRRLGQVYVLLIDLARKKRAAAQAKPANAAEVAV